jgi:hypothetical protein
MRGRRIEYSDVMECQSYLIECIWEILKYSMNEKLSIRMKKKYLDPLKISIDHSYSEYPRIYLISLNIDEFYAN